MRKADLATGLLYVVSSTALAYEVGTHAKITDEAYKRSTISKSLKLAQYGLYDLNYVIGTQFKEVAGAQVVERVQFRYEWEVEYAALFGRNAPRPPGTNAPPFDGTYPYRPVGWMVAGAIREDDGTRISQPLAYFLEPSTFPEIYGRNNIEEVLQSDVPIGGHLNRFCNHFYDPTKGSTSLSGAGYTGYPACPKEGLVTGLLGAGMQSGIAAPAWALALQTGTSFFDAVAELQSRVNHFAISDAKEAMWRAATGYDGVMQTKMAVNGADRMKYWATTFRTLGGVAHLLQDMAQPQHTRNEKHPNGSYEQYVEWRTAGSAKQLVSDKRSNFREVSEKSYFPWSDLMWGSYPIVPRFTKYEHYWQSNGGQGLAVYSNRGFLTNGNNIGDRNYDDPPQDYHDSKYSVVQTQEDVAGENIRITRLHYSVPDSLTGGSDTIAMTRKTTLGWATQGTPVSANLWRPDTSIYDAQAGLQLPRAVAYSAGLIDHFFRGQLRIDTPANGIFAYVDTSKEDPDDARYSKTAFRTLKFKVTNTTPSIAPPGGGTVEQNIANARLVAGVKYFKNKCWNASLDLTGEWGAPNIDYRDCREEIVNQLVSPIDILGAERLAVSRSCKVNGVSAASGVAIPAQATVDVECDFYEEPIPFDGTDMKLVVAMPRATNRSDFCAV